MSGAVARRAPQTGQQPGAAARAGDAGIMPAARERARGSRRCSAAVIFARRPARPRWSPTDATPCRSIEGIARRARAGGRVSAPIGETPCGPARGIGRVRSGPGRGRRTLGAARCHDVGHELAFRRGHARQPMGGQGQALTREPPPPGVVRRRPGRRAHGPPSRSGASVASSRRAAGVQTAWQRGAPRGRVDNPAGRAAHLAVDPVGLVDERAAAEGAGPGPDAVGERIAQGGRVHGRASPTLRKTGSPIVVRRSRATAPFRTAR
jgi:hypothetical protein